MKTETETTPKSQHTAGEWKTEECSNGGLVVILGEERHAQRIQVINEANAKLIAAAPELLEALKILIKSINPQDVNKEKHFNGIKLGSGYYVGSKGIPTNESIHIAIDAIKKATE